MAYVEKTKALVLKHMPYSNTSQIVWVFTKGRGIVHLIAKGSMRLPRASSSFPAPFDLTGWYELSYRPAKKSLSTAREAKLIEGFDHLRKNLDSYIEAECCLEILTKVFMQGDSHDEMLRDSLSYLKLLRIQAARFPLRVHFYAKLLRELGWWPQFGHCIDCERDLDGSKMDVQLRIPFGAVCASCRRGSEQSFGWPAIAYLEQEWQVDWGFVPELDPGNLVLNEAWNILSACLIHHMDKAPHSIRYLRGESLSNIPIEQGSVTNQLRK